MLWRRYCRIPGGVGGDRSATLTAPILIYKRSLCPYLSATAASKNMSRSLNPGSAFLAMMLIIATGLLYGQFVHNPFVFDDVPFFGSKAVEASADIQLRPRLRWLLFTSFGLTYRIVGLEIPVFRMGNLLLHAGVAIALMVWMFTLVNTTDKRVRSEAALRLATFGAALLFVLHPVAVYGAGYLMQRSTAMATLFVILMLLAFLRGLTRENSAWLATGVACYVLALFSKEHAIAAPLLVIAQGVLIARSGSLMLKGRVLQPNATLKELTSALVSVLAWPMVGCTLIAAYVALLAKGVLGAAYEPFAAEMIASMATESSGQLPQLTHALSAFNQSWLFFKYLFLWLVPNTQWMSVDMRENLTTSYLAFPQLAGAIGFITYAVIATRLLWRGGRTGTVGLALLAPWVLFATEFSTIRVQEVFVLYRSYLWFAPAFVVVALLLATMRARFAVLAASGFSVIFFALAYERLTVFSTPLALWRDAARLVDGKSPVAGDFRIHYNLGNQLGRRGEFKAAVERYDQAIARLPTFSHAYNNRGNAYMGWERYDEAMADFNRAAAINPKDGRFYMGMGYASRALGQPEKADEYFKQSCSLGWQNGCKMKK